jgi:hypothetical protein
MGKIDMNRRPLLTLIMKLFFSAPVSYSNNLLFIILDLY